MDDRVRRLVRQLHDDDASVAERRMAARDLAAHDCTVAVDALVRMATSEGRSDLDELHRKAGASIAAILARSGSVDAVPLWGFTTSAYDGYDAAIAAHVGAAFE